ncbi:uncharacterized protein PHACADRAFT_205299 [Phanerochaete carnosa HHB-10118-sp]|uniref:RBR-type E3 ubiquitin transferase n=1 Tax=Phanerochaete carnosa (strain HHB-10118-sp) TaxID=650164 RepID=K5W5C8_PHACS|nr:uncharacterized protein PHACADRAFT_205299 [Phanerochaete carnosa HHB-10118-sp]EKM59123.1 hypothetical protein PHACADRAFT_205299 [Phanerochaete carnosa HHB-10118-sp]
MSSDILRDIATGQLTDYVVAHGRSQYSGAGGLSACGLAAMNCARLVLLKERADLRGDALLEEIMKESTTDEVLSICERWSSVSHLDIEDIIRSSIFNRSLKLLVVDYGRSDYSGFTRLLERLRNESNRRGKSSCAVITRPPEIVACLCISHPDGEFYVIFDSHPRPGAHPDSAAFIFNKSAFATATYLSNLLRYDSSLVSDRDFGWQTQLLGNFSGHLVVAQADTELEGAEYWASTAMEASLEGLALHADQAQLKAENESLKADIARLRDQIARLQRPQRAQSVWSEAKRSYPAPYPDDTQPTKRASFISSLAQQGSSAIAVARSYTSSLSRSPSQSQPSTMKSAPLTSASSRSSQQSVPTMPSPVTVDPTNGAKIERDLHRGYDETADDLAFALAQQHMYDEEHRDLERERERISLSQSFTCNICLDRHSHEDAAQVDNCAHTFCRDCIRGHVSSQIGQRLYPIVCPLCSTEKGEREPTVLSDGFVQQLGLSEEDYVIFVELEMASFSMLLHCRGCDKSFFVVKDELDSINVITCPLPGCGKSWCKTCSHFIDDISQTHTCDGTAELQRLMGDKGWKYCPGCRTPAEKIGGCNHMACKSPGCNTHFCYLCGEAIVTSVNTHDVNRALSRHYAGCQQF